MSFSKRGRIGGLILASALALAMVPGPTAAAASTIYNSMPSVLPGNVPSLGYEATSTVEFGDKLTFAAATPRLLTTAKVMMSSWGCESGGWNTGDCVTTPGATFSHPLTIKFYDPGDLSTPIGAVTQSFAIPYRPSADNTNCTGGNAGKWYQASTTTCFNGFATVVTFDLSASGIAVPDTAIVTIAYNTSHYGSPAMGELACYTESGGCGYDSLNVALIDFGTYPVSTGSNPAPDDAYLNSTWGGNYCDGGTAGTGTFRLDAGCWTGYKPAITLTASPVFTGYTFTGFFAPVDNLPTVNSVKAGQAIPVKFSLAGDQGLNIFAAGYPKSQQMACNTNAEVDGIEQTVTAGNSSLSFDPISNTYTYVWKTDKGWANTCRQLVVELSDGTYHRANFQFKK
jgi:hypothetical protein